MKAFLHLLLLLLLVSTINAKPNRDSPSTCVRNPHLKVVELYGQVRQARACFLCRNKRGKIQPKMLEQILHLKLCIYRPGVGLYITFFSYLVTVVTVVKMPVLK